ncbi:MAG: alkaline phosphatase family protein, partial [Vicinamibacteria bacterium]
MRFALLVGLFAVFACQANRRPLPPPEPPSSAPSERDRDVEMFARSYFPGRSGQIFLVTERGNFLVSRPDDVYRYMHGSPWEYDVEIPLLFHGAPYVAKGSFPGPANQQNVAPTLLALLGSPVPTTMTGSALTKALGNTSGEPPKAVFLAVLDGFGADTFERLEPRLPTLARLRREGAWFPDAAIDYLPTVTAAGHSTISTGADPRFHGIQANATFDRRTMKSDEPFPKLSPSNYMVLTLADHWSLATSGRAVIVAQGTTPRAAVALAGHGACMTNGRPIVMTMFDERKAGWVTNAECFRMPDYLE